MNIIHTGLEKCYDLSGREIPCHGTCQDAAFRSGVPWPASRFTSLSKKRVRDELTGLEWTLKANFFDFPLTWQQALDEVKEMNRGGFDGYNDWRLPNRREMRSVVSHGQRKPALPADHPFTGVFLGWYWTSTTSALARAYAWYVHLEGARMFYGGKEQRYLAWPVRGSSVHIPRTGQTECFNTRGEVIECAGTGQDPDISAGQSWPAPRFSRLGHEVTDHLTSRVWLDPVVFAGRAVNWQEALDLAQRLTGGKDWRLPNINELESLVDASAHSPALPQGHPFTGLMDGYWSSTTSFFEPDWAYVLYMRKGAVGVGYKPGVEFYTWPVRCLDRG